MEKKHKPTPRQYSFVLFDIDSVGREFYLKYFIDTFPEGKLFTFLGEVPNAPGHCILVDLTKGVVLGMYHTENFREATEDEV